MTTLSLTHITAAKPLRRAHWHIADFALGLMLVGPLVMPWFLQSGWPPLVFFGSLIHAIGVAICPQLEYSPIYGGTPFAVCYRCSAALVGLIIARWLHRPGGAMRDLSLRTRLLMPVVCLVWLQVDLTATRRGWWEGSIPLMLGHGVIYGISAGGVVFAGLLLIDRLRGETTKIPQAES